MKNRHDGPFDVLVRDLTGRPGEMRRVHLEVPLKEKWGEGIVSVPAGEIIDVEAKLESVHEGILVTADVATEYEGECGRCLTPISEPVEVEFLELFAYPDKEETDFEVQDDHVDLETLVRDAVVLALPFQPVCDAGCLGLDPDSGEKRTKAAAEEESEPIDPRWAALKQIADQNPA